MEEEKSYYLCADDEDGTIICMDDGIANYRYRKGQGYVKDPALYRFLWPDSRDFGNYKEITEEQAKKAEAQCEAGEHIDVPVEEDSINFGAPWEYKSEQDSYREGPAPENLNEMTNDEILAKLKEMF